MSPVTSAGGVDVLLARRVKTVNTQLGGKTVGVGRHRYRLRWILGIEAYLQQPNQGRGSPAPETSCGTRRCGHGVCWPPPRLGSWEVWFWRTLFWVRYDTHNACSCLMYSRDRRTAPQCRCCGERSCVRTSSTAAAVLPLTQNTWGRTSAHITPAMSKV